MTNRSRRFALVAAMVAAMAGSPGDVRAGSDFADAASAYAAGDYGHAASLWRGLAEAGDPAAQFNMGLMAEAGFGMPADAVVAAAWYRRAAAQGLAAAQYNLAVLLTGGRGIAEDLGEALYWLSVASRLDDHETSGRAGAAAQALGPRLPADQAAAVVDRAARFVPRVEPRQPPRAVPYLVLGRRDVIAVQERLASLGYDPGRIDGELGPNTHAAIAAYLADQGLDWPLPERLSRRLLQQLAIE